jgi:hypothetical protein
MFDYGPIWDFSVHKEYEKVKDRAKVVLLTGIMECIKSTIWSVKMIHSVITFKEK